MSSRVRTDDLHATLDRLLGREASVASGFDGQLSKADQSKAPALVAQAAADLRVPGGRLKTDALSKHLSEQARGLTASVNQPSGVGRAYFSKAEARAAAKADPALGAQIQRAHAIASGQLADVDGIAEARARAASSGDGVFRQLASEDLAQSHQDPYGRSTTWLVKTGENSFVWGRDDLWAERFDVDARTGAVTVTGEH